MEKDKKIENKNLENNQVLEPVEEPKDDKFLENIPTKDDEIIKKLDEVNQKLDSFTILEDDDNDDDKENDKKKNIGLALAFVALVVVVAGLFAFKKEVKNSNE